MRKFWKKAAAAVTAFALLGGALPGNFAGAQLLRPAVTAKAAGCCTFDEETGTLTLHGNVDKAEVYDFLSDFTEYWRWHYREYPWDGVSVKCEEGTVFPEDCSQLFASTSAFYDYTAPPNDGDTSPTPTYDPDDIWYNSPIIDFDLRNADTSHVTNMQDMFQGCSVCKSMILDFDTSNVTNMSYMFSDCLYVTSLDFSSFDMTNVANAECMFYRCEKLKTIYAGRGWNVNPEETNCTKMFYNCPKLVGGLGTEWSEFYINGDYAHIDGGMQNPGYLTYKARGNQARGVSITLGGEIAVNFFLDLHPDTAQIKVTGPANSAVPEGTFTFENALEYYPYTAGTPREMTLSYPVNATQAGNKITLEFLDKDGNPLPVYNTAGKRIESGLLTYSVQQYIDDTPLYSDNAKLKALVEALDNYCKAAHNHFLGTTDPVSGIENVTLAQFEPYQYPLYGMEITLTLNSKTEARIISEQVEQGAFNGDGYLPTMWGTDKGYYAIYEIGAPQLASTDTYQIGDTAFRFSPLTYGYYVMKKSDNESLKTLVRALYVYAQAAKAYPNGTD